MKRHDAEAASLKLAETVEGAREDSACLLTLLHRPSRLQLALPLEEKTAGCVADALGASGPSSAPTGRAACSAPSSPTTAPSSPTRRRSRRCSARAGRDEAVLLRPQAQRPEGRLRAQPRRDQEAAAQGRRNQVRPARPGRPGAGHVARELRAPRRARLRDARAPFRAMLGEDAAALLDAYGVGDVPIGELDLTPGLIERARAERGDAPLA